MSIIEKARNLRAKIEELARNLDDAEALEAPEFFPAWSGESVNYLAGERIRYGSVLYTVLQSHTSQNDWAPDVAASLFAKVLIPDPEVIPFWERPDSTNPYMVGDKVIFNDRIYESIIDNNVWSPEEYPAGWVMVT